MSALLYLGFDTPQPQLPTDFGPITLVPSPNRGYGSILQPIVFALVDGTGDTIDEFLCDYSIDPSLRAGLVVETIEKIFAAASDTMKVYLSDGVLYENDPAIQCTDLEHFRASLIAKLDRFGIPFLRLTLQKA